MYVGLPSPTRGSTDLEVRRTGQFGLVVQLVYQRLRGLTHDRSQRSLDILTENSRSAVTAAMNRRTRARREKCKCRPLGRTCVDPTTGRTCPPVKAQKINSLRSEVKS